MVYFTCDACGEQLKKPTVEKHLWKCKNCYLLTCIDCLKDFYGDDYKSHNQCMSEDQRYSKEGREGWDPAVGQGNKGEKKQQQWVGKLRELLETANSLDPAVRHIIDTIVDHDNIPRKRPKFINFIKNIMRNKAQMSDIEKTWDLFSQALAPPKVNPPPVAPAPPSVPAPPEQPKQSKKEKKKKKKEAEVEPMEEEEGDTKREKKKDKKKKKKKKAETEEEEDAPVEATAAAVVDEEAVPQGKKRKLEETMEVDQNEESQTEPSGKRTKFDWNQTITALLAKKGNEMKLNKLKKKAVAEFMAQNPQTHLGEAEVGAKFDKKIKKKAYKILKDRVQLANPEAGPDCDNVNGGGEATTVNGSSHVNGKVANGSSHVNGKKAKGSSQVNGKAVNGSDHGANNTNGAVINGAGSAAAEENKISFNKWEATSFGNDAQTEKFRRLMGIKTTKPPQLISGVKRDDKKIFRDLETGFEKARESHFRAKGMGLGFS